MRIVKEKVQKNGEIRIPKEIIKDRKLKPGEEVELRVENNKLIVKSQKGERTQLKINRKIVDQLVENEELFEPEEV